MGNEQVNPYASPQEESNTFSDSPPASASALRGFRPRSVSLMIVLTILTLGLYMNFWVHQLASALNQKLEHGRISMVLVGLFWAVSLTSVLWTVPEILSNDDPTIVRIGNVLTRADLLLAICMAFTIRGGLNTLFLASRRHPAWFRGLWTFLFGIGLVESVVLRQKKIEF